MDPEEHSSIMLVLVLILLPQFGLTMIMDLMSNVPLVNVNVLLVPLMMYVLLVTLLLDSL
jgi:hypothetical protein